MSGVRTNGEARCPACQTKLDGATAAGHKATPTGGDLSVCAYCALVLEFNNDLTVRAAPPALLDELPPRQRQQLEILRALVRVVRA
jgi:hypothetical protein